MSRKIPFLKTFYMYEAEAKPHSLRMNCKYVYLPPTPTPRNQHLSVFWITPRCVCHVFLAFSCPSVPSPLAQTQALTLSCCRLNLQAQSVSDFTPQDIHRLKFKCQQPHFLCPRKRILFWKTAAVTKG